MKQPPQKPPTKAQLRAQLQRAVADYRRKGGEIQQIPRGVTGRDEQAPYSRPLFETPASSRTAVDDVVRAIESRRKKKPEPPKKANKGPKEKIIYDDFGEPVRKVWVDE